MSSESKIDPAIIKKTQDTLGRIIQAPSLTEKLLNRPPVQFVQDIVKSVIKNTGFMKGLYSSEELDAAYIKASKENKLAFLNKLIVIVGLVNGEHMSVKASKIAAGVESEKTNELLQLLAKAINMKPDNDEYVKKALKKLKSAEEQPEEKEKEKSSRDRDRSRDKKEADEDRDKEKREKSRSSKHEERDRDRDREKDKDRERDREKDKDRERDREKDKDRERDREKDRDRHRGGDKDREREKDKDREREKDKERDRDRDRHHRDDKDRDREKSSRDRDREKDRDRGDRDKERSKDKSREESSRSKHRDTSPVTGEKESSNSRSGGRAAARSEKEEESNEQNDDNPRRRPPSARGPRVQIERDENYALKSQAETMEDNRNMARPTTARPGAPRPRLGNDTEDTQKSSGGTDRKSRTQIVNGESDDDDDFVVKENKFQEDENTKNWQRDMDNESKKKKSGENKQDDEDEENHGALVKKILESKEQLEHGSELNRDKGDLQKPLIQMDMQRKKERERIQKEIDKLRESIQTLTKASIPLGRTLDFLQEDIDMMQKEITKWSDEYDHNMKSLKRSQMETSSLLEPYKAGLSELDNQMGEQLEKIAAVKRKILVNEEKISKLLFNVGKKN